MRHEKFKVITESPHQIRTQIWDSGQPCALDTDFKWIIELTRRGPVLRYVDPTQEPGKVPRARWIDPDQLSEGVTLPLNDDQKITLKRLTHFPSPMNRTKLFKGDIQFGIEEDVVFKKSILALGIPILILFGISYFFSQSISNTIEQQEEEEATVKYVMRPDTPPLEVPPPPPVSQIIPGTQAITPVAPAPAPPEPVKQAPPPPPRAVQAAPKFKPAQASQAKTSLNSLKAALGGAMSLAHAPAKGPALDRDSTDLFHANPNSKNSAATPVETQVSLNAPQADKRSADLTQHSATLRSSAQTAAAKGAVSRQLLDLLEQPPQMNDEQGLLAEEVGAVIHKHLDEVRYCHDAAMVYQPNINGKLIVHFSVNAAGGVKNPSIASSTLNNDKLAQCIIGRLSKWKFPKPKGGGEVSIDYPFIFKMLGKDD